jgi:hypothetical protein
MDTKSRIMVLLLIMSLFTGSSIAQNNQAVIEDIAKSHIDGNVPDKKDFDNIMKRDLEKYFAERYLVKPTVTWELLRDGPTQTGISYPKYYAWVRVRIKDSLLIEGATRVAAIEKKYFDVTHFVGRQEIENQPEQIFAIFPKPVCEKIKEYLKH